MLTLPKASLDISAFVLAAVTAGGGIMGFAKSGSLPSIIAGGSVGLLCMCPLELPTALTATAYNYA